MPGDAEFDAAPAWLSKAAYTIEMMPISVPAAKNSNRAVVSSLPRENRSLTSMGLCAIALENLIVMTVN